MSSRINFEDFLKTKKINEKALFKYFNLIFDDLYERVENNKVKDEKISMETMRIFFQYPEIIFKLIFSALKIPFENRISKVQFNEIIFKLYCSDNKEKMKLYFNIFSPDEKQLIYCENIKIILFNFHLINYSNNFNYLNKVINNLNLKENMSFLQWEELNSRNSDLFYLINFFIENTKPFNDFLINELFYNEIKNNIIKNELKNNKLEDKITKHFKLYLNSLKKEKDDLFFNDLTMNDHKVKTKDFYEEDISNKNKILDFSDNNMKLQTSKSYSNLRMNNLLLQQCDNITITGNSSTQCEDDYQIIDILPNCINKLSMIEEQEKQNQKLIKVLTYNSKEKKLIENTIEFFGNIIKINFNDTFKLIDLRYSFFEKISKKTILNNIIFDKRIDIFGQLSFNRKHSMKLLFDNIIDYENFVSKIHLNKLFSSFYQKYELQEKIGFGGFGEVYKVINKETFETFAVKVFHKNDLNVNERINSLYNEIYFLKLFINISHENLVKTYDIFENMNDIYCVIEYVSNENLFNYINNNSNINLKQIKNISKQIINGVNYIESLGIIHQDLKLENLMVKKYNNNNNINIKIIDFGLSIIMSKNDFCSGTIGTPNYMAPEIINGDEYNYKIDIWSLGIILYFIRYKRLPFNDNRKDNRNFIYENIRRFRIKFNEPSLKLSEEDDFKFKQIILKCLTIDPDERIFIQELKNDNWFNL